MSDGLSAPEPLHRTRTAAARRWLSRWPQWTPAAVIMVASGYLIAGLVGLLGGPYVFAPPSNPDNLFGDHWLSAVPGQRVAAVTVVLAAAGLSLMLLQRLDTRWLRPVLIGAGAALAGFVALVLPGPLALDTIPVLNLLNLERLDWPTVHVVLLAYAGVAAAASTLAYARRTRGACVHCGRRAGRPGWPSRRWARVGLAASIAAFLTPFGYAVVRLFWAAGIPVGTSRAFLDQINAANPGQGTVIIELVLAGMAIGGGLLCFGLTRPWSEIWPRWIPRLAGRPVPRWVPIVPATLCGIGLTGNGTVLLPGLINAASGAALYYPGTETPMTWLSHLPAVSLVLWGPLVLVSILAFHYRTRGECQVCRRALSGLEVVDLDTESAG